VAVRSLASSGEDLEAVELAVRTAMMRLGGSLLGRLLAADTGHRGPRIDWGQFSNAIGSRNPMPPKITPIQGALTSAPS